MKTVISARAMLFVAGFCLLLFGLDAAFAQTTNSCVSPLNSDFLTKYEVMEFVECAETNSAGPFSMEATAFVFEAVINLATNLDGMASSAVLSLPGEGPSLMKKVGTTEFAVGAVTNAFTNITSAYPDGTYEFTIFSNTIAVTLPEGADLPNAPTLSNYAAAQKINPAEDFTLRWSPFITGGVLDAISVTVDDTNGGTLFKSGDFGCPGELDGTATSIVIPANTLASNATYRTQIIFVKVYTFDTNSIPNAALLAGTEAETFTTISSGTTQISDFGSCLD